MIEEWRDISGYNGAYQVSNFGRVRSLPRWVRNRHSHRLIKGTVLKPGIGNSGYYFVNPHIDGEGGPRDVHRMVALEFLGHENDHLQVNHIDGNKLNNHISNLEFVTPLQNTVHARQVLGKIPNYDRSGHKNPMWGKNHTQETIQKLKGSKSLEHRKKISDFQKRRQKLIRDEKTRGDL